MTAVVEALLFGVDGYEGVPEWTTSAQDAIWGAAFGTMGGGRNECVVDCIFDERDVLYNRLQAFGAFGVAKLQQCCSIGYDFSGMLEVVQELDPQHWPSIPTNHDFWALGGSQKPG
ncbi:hypothetical protein BDV23DRAFT_186673 [Aspergillus alliaceus]|uniref:Uncharacterized protein n=1 Tax=Petromyces alliaceus TaxID=209559 RepID=A0A5N7BZ29_PETAA|nr:hypothetical protein BDV23DRAFT_186673 [Aspergillus alliaceus]